MVAARISARTLDALLGRRQDGAPAYAGLADRIRLLVLDGRLPAGTRLPAERDLAARLGLSRTTVTAAYRRLREAGFAHSVRGSGTTTALPGARPGPSAAPSGVVDLTKAAPPATRMLPAALASASAALGPLLADTGYDVAGLPELRRAIAERYTERGLPTGPEQVLVTTGAQSAIWMLARTLLARGDRALVESPSYPNALDARRLAGARLVTAPVSAEDGWDIEALEAAIARTRPTLAYLMPDFHNPTGRTMSRTERERMRRAAAAAGTVVIADEIPAELDIDRGRPLPPPAAEAGAHGAEVVLVGSASKLFWGGLRVGWIRAESGLLARIAAARAATDMATPVLEQLITARLIPESEAIIAERRDQLAAGRAAVLETVGRLLPGWTLPARLDGGLAAWIGLGAPVSSQLALAARARGVLITAGPRFGVDGAFERHLRLPITAEPEVLREAVGTLADLWPEVGRLGGSGLDAPASVA